MPPSFSPCVCVVCVPCFSVLAGSTSSVCGLQRFPSPTFVHRKHHGRTFIAMHFSGQGGEGSE